MNKTTPLIIIVVLIFSLASVLTPKVRGDGSCWVTKAPMPDPPRAAMSCAAIGSNIYVLGGDLFGPSFLSKNEVYDTVNDAWAMPDSTPPMSQQRSLLVTEVVNGKLYAIGGLPDTSGWCSSDLNEMYDPNTRTWTTETSLPIGIHAMAGAVLGDKIYILGGYSPPTHGGDNMLDTNYIYNTIDRTWTTEMHMQVPRRCEVAAAVNGKIYVIGGLILIHTDYGYYTEETDVNEEYNPELDSWIFKKPMPVPVERAACAVIGDKIYVIGGTTTVNSADCYLNLVQVYDTNQDTWSTSTVKGMLTARAYITACVVSGTIYVMGGFDGVKCLSTNEALTIDTTTPTIDIWTPKKFGLYSSDSGNHYSFTVTDDCDPNPSVTATLSLFDGQPVAAAQGALLPTQCGVYTLTVTGTDASGNVAQKSVTFVVYDPSAGFVTGGGWINSPPGAYASDPTLTGKATFAFVSKYQKGANEPDGNTEFKFQVADLSFKSSSYQWLVVAGARAQYKGTGTINGAGGYGFILTAIDGDLTHNGSSDMFRIKIWDASSCEVVYDNQLGAPITADPITAVSEGSIVIHH